MPIASTNVLIVTRNTANIDNDAENDEANHREDLDRREDKLGLAKSTDTEEVDGDDGDEKDGDPHRRVDTVAALPELHREGSGHDFERERHKPLEGIAVIFVLEILQTHSKDRILLLGSNSLPRHRETPCLVDETTRINGESSSHWVSDCKLTQSVGGAKHRDSNKTVCDEQTCRPTGRKGGSRTDE